MMIRYKKLLAFVNWARAQDPPVDFVWARGDRVADSVTEAELRELVTQHNQASPSPASPPRSTPAPEPEFQRLRAPLRARAALADALVAYATRSGLDAAKVALAAERVRSGLCTPADLDACRALRSLLGGVRGRDLERAFVAVGAPLEMPGAAGVFEGLFALPGPRLVLFNPETMRVRSAIEGGAVKVSDTNQKSEEAKREKVKVSDTIQKSEEAKREKVKVPRSRRGAKVAARGRR